MHLPLQTNLICTFSFGFPCGIGYHHQQFHDTDHTQKQKSYQYKDCFSKNIINKSIKPRKPSVQTSQKITSYGFQNSQPVTKKYHGPSRILRQNSQQLKSVRKTCIKEKYSLKKFNKFEQIQNMSFSISQKYEQSQLSIQKGRQKKFNIVNEYAINLFHKQEDYKNVDVRQANQLKKPLPIKIKKNRSVSCIQKVPNNNVYFQNPEYLSSSVSHSLKTIKKSDANSQQYYNYNPFTKFPQKQLPSDASMLGSQKLHANILLNKNTFEKLTNKYKNLEFLVQKKVSSIFDSFQGENHEVSLVVGRQFTKKSKDLISERSAQQFQSPQKKPRIIRLFSGTTNM